jgi:anti-sigma factor RsiW
MKCSKAHKFLSPYIDGELSEREVSALEDHMKVCDKCRTECEENKELHGFFSGVAEFKAPYGFHTRVMANLVAGKAVKKPGVSVLTRLAEALVVIAVITTGMISGAFLVKDLVPEKAQDVIASLSLDIFDSTPPGSLGGAYLAMTEERNEK